MLITALQATNTEQSQQLIEQRQQLVERDRQMKEMEERLRRLDSAMELGSRNVGQAETGSR